MNTLRNREKKAGSSRQPFPPPGRLLALFATIFGFLPVQQACRAQQPWPLWQAYTQRFLDGQGRVLDRSAGDRTTSEGEAYALFFALVDNDRAHFDRILSWTEANLAGGDLTLRLPGWNWGKTAAGEWKLRDTNSASDADLWMAYTLLEAGRLWHEPRFDKLGRILAQQIAHVDVASIQGIGTVLTPGPSGFHAAPNPGGSSSSSPDDRWFLNPSYMPPPLLARMARALPEGPWSGMERALPALIGGAASHGFAMDWVSAGDGTVHPSAPPQQGTSGKQETQAAGSYDAIRVYLWVGMSDAGTPHLQEMIGHLAGMTAYLREAPVPPLEVSQTGAVLRADAPPGFSAAVIPFLQQVGAQAQAKQQLDRIAATRDPASGLYGRGMEYYDQNLALFCSGWEEKRFRFERDGALRVRWK